MTWRQFCSRVRRALERPAAGGWLAGWLGSAGERLAARHLRRQGYAIVARRYRTPLGEIDLVARDGECIVFVEVKTLRSQEGGHPADAVNHAKQVQLTKLALAFLKRFGWLERRARFDVVSIVWGADDATPEIVHYRNAFEPIGRGQMFS